MGRTAEAVEDEIEDIEEPEAADEPDAETGEDDAEVQARAERMGWAPKEKWRGAEGEWKSAKEFIKHTEDSNGRLKHQVKNLDERLANAERMNKVITDRLKEQDRIGYERALREIKDQKREAARVGDVDAFEELEQREENIRKNAAPKEIAPPGEPAEITAWKQTNAWFDSDAAMTREAMGIYEGYAAAHPKASIAEALEEVSRKMPLLHPEKFENPNRSTAPRVEGNGALRGGKKGKGYADLPPEAKRAAKQFVDEKLFKSVEEYAADYFREVDK